jgi:hypothetical protein
MSSNTLYLFKKIIGPFQYSKPEKECPKTHGINPAFYICIIFLMHFEWGKKNSEAD